MKKLIKSIALLLFVISTISCSDDANKEIGRKSIAEMAKITPEFSDFRRSLDSLGLTSTFEDAGDLTVFIPTNSGMLAAANTLGYANIDSIFKHETAKDSLRNILKYHTLTSRVSSTSLTDNQSVTSLYGQDFTVTITPVLPADATYPGETNIITLTGNNPDNATTTTVIARDVQATNGIIHPVDAVLIPTF